MSKYCEDLFGDLLLKQPLETHPVCYILLLLLFFFILARFKRDYKLESYHLYCCSLPVLCFQKFLVILGVSAFWYKLLLI